MFYRYRRVQRKREEGEKKKEGGVRKRRREGRAFIDMREAGIQETSLNAN